MSALLRMPRRCIRGNADIAQRAPDPPLRGYDLLLMQCAFRLRHRQWRRVRDDALEVAAIERAVDPKGRGAKGRYCLARANRHRHDRPRAARGARQQHLDRRPRGPALRDARRVARQGHARGGRPGAGDARLGAELARSRAGRRGLPNRRGDDRGRPRSAPRAGGDARRAADDAAGLLEPRRGGPRDGRRAARGPRARRRRGRGVGRRAPRDGAQRRGRGAAVGARSVAAPARDLARRDRVAVGRSRGARRGA